MATKTSKVYPYAFVWVTAIVLILFCAAALAAYLGWVPEWVSGSDHGVMSDTAGAARRP